MLEVYHWYVQPYAEENTEVVEAYRDILFGDAETTKLVLQSLSDWAIKGLLLQPVARVDGDSLDRAWTLTNHIDQAWTQNAGVKVLGHGRRRSSSVGDVMRLESVVYLVGKFGFDSIGPECVYALGEAQ